MPAASSAKVDDYKPSGAAHLRIAAALCLLSQEELASELRQPDTTAHNDPSSFYSILLQAVQVTCQPAALRHTIANIKLSASDAEGLRLCAQNDGHNINPDTTGKLRLSAPFSPKFECPTDEE